MVCNGAISSVIPGIKCTSRIIPRVTVTAADIAAVAKVVNHFYKNVERFNIKFEKLPEIDKDDNSRTLIYSEKQLKDIKILLTT